MGLNQKTSPPSNNYGKFVNIAIMKEVTVRLAQRSSITPPTSTIILYGLSFGRSHLTPGFSLGTPVSSLMKIDARQHVA